MGRILILAGFLTIIPTVIEAQGRGGVPAHSGGVTPNAVIVPGAIHGVSMAPGRAVGHGSSPAGNHYVYPRSASGPVTLRRATPVNRAMSGGHGINRVRSGTGVRGGQSTTARRGEFVSEFSDDSDSVPGLGFDQVHLAATRPNLFHGRHRGNDGAVLFPFSGGGYFLPTAPVVEDIQGETQPAEDVEEVDNTAPVGRRARTRSVDRLPVEPALGPPAPQPDVPEYVFVRRDGTVFFAVAYSWEQGSLRYVSSEGLRRSISRDALDLAATEQFNEQRGMTFRSPA